MTDLTMSQFASKDDLLDAQAARIAELEAEVDAERHHHGIRNASAVRTLHALGYSWRGTDAWQPPAEQGKYLHQIAEPATVQAAPSEVMGALRALHDSVELAIQRGALSERALEIIIMQPATDVLMRAAAPQAVQAAVPKWIDDPHDIEQGQMLNPEWVKLQQSDAPAHPAEGVPSPVTVVDALQSLIEAIQFTPLGVRQIHAMERARAAIAATHPTQQGLDAEYQRGYQDGYNRRDAEVKGALV